MGRITERDDRQASPQAGIGNQDGAMEAFGTALGVHDDAERRGDGEPLLLVVSAASVPLAFALSQRLGLPLELLIVRPITLPDHPDELLGGVVDGEPPYFFIDETAARRGHPPPGYLKAEHARQVAEMERLHRMYFGEDRPEDHSRAGRDIVLVDDGRVDAATLVLALKALRHEGAASVRLALPRGIVQRAGQERIETTGEGSIGGFDDLIALPPVGNTVSAGEQDIRGMLSSARTLQNRLH